MASRPRASTKSSNPRTTGDINKTPGGPRADRADRDDTPEAKAHIEMGMVAAFDVK